MDDGKSCQPVCDVWTEFKGKKSAQTSSMQKNNKIQQTHLKGFEVPSKQLE